MSLTIMKKANLMARRLTPASLSTVSCSCFFSTHGGGGGAGSTASSSARLSSLDEPSSTVTAEQPNIKMHAVYVHHVTKVVLKHLQEHQSEWLIDHGLDRGLRLNANGTAILQFPSSSSSTGTTNGHSGTSSSVGSGRIWTSFDSATKKHWLCIFKGKLRGRFLLKDTSSSSHNGNTEKPRPSFTKLHESDLHIRRVVDEMVRKVSATSSS